MKINRQFQDLHTDQPSTDWVLKQHLERDICLLYHQLANYSYIMGDLYYGDVFGLPYWDHLDMPGLDPDQRAFIRDGCLVMILAMASECVDGSGTFLIQHLESCRRGLDELTTDDSDTQRLVSAIRLALDLIDRGEVETPALTKEYAWAHKRYVRRYFLERADDFRTNPYFREGAG